MSFINKHYKIEPNKYIVDIVLPEIPMEDIVLGIFDKIIFSLSDSKMYNRKNIEENYDYLEILEWFIKVSEQMFIEDYARQKAEKK